MNTLTKKIVLSGLVLLLAACAHHPHNYGSYPSNGPYYSGYGNYQGHHHHHPRPSAPHGYWGHGRPYGDHHSDNYYQNNYYNRPQLGPRPMPSYDHHEHRP